jgi:hypothetical protein
MMAKGKHWSWISIARDVPTFFEYKREGLLSYGGWLKTWLRPRTYIADLYWNEPAMMNNLILRRLLKRKKA